MLPNFLHYITHRPIEPTFMNQLISFNDFNDNNDEDFLRAAVVCCSLTIAISLLSRRRCNGLKQEAQLLL